VSRNVSLANVVALPDRDRPVRLLGRRYPVPGQYYRPLVGVILILAGSRLLWPRELTAHTTPADPPVIIGIVFGAIVGLLSGLTGTGGGIFLSPILLFAGWSDPRIASGVAAGFILCNSIAGLLGNVAVVQSLPADLPLYAGAVLFGAIIGTTFGTRFSAPIILKVLGVVLIVAGCKLIGVY